MNDSHLLVHGLTTPCFEKGEVFRFLAQFLKKISDKIANGMLTVSSCSVIICLLVEYSLLPVKMPVVLRQQDLLLTVEDK